MWLHMANGVSTYVCTCVCVCVFLSPVCLCVFTCTWEYVCVREYSRALRDSDAEEHPFLLSLRVINHAATLIYVPLLLALSFILGGRISPSRSSGETASACSIHIAF